MHLLPFCLQVLTSRNPPCQEVLVGSLSLSLSRQLITRHLQTSTIPLSVHVALTDILLSKLGICNPLFAHELVRYLERKAKDWMGKMDEEQLKEIARNLPDDLTK